MLLATLMAGFGAELCGPDFRGCPFINAAAEYPDQPVHQAVQAHRAWFRQTIRNLVTAAGCADADHTTATLLLLRDDAMGGGDLDEPETVREHLERAVVAVLT
ncbi:hypothetical protein [Streptomyces sp. NBC_01637]|nr:hypothetical protein OH719_46790 [Streptomyces sp. NBC_01653]WTD94274.1 hypothetical protein OG891_46785 [Streptomyces sp. NBC_01637]